MGLGVVLRLPRFRRVTATPQRGGTCDLCGRTRPTVNRGDRRLYSVAWSAVCERLCTGFAILYSRIHGWPGHELQFTGTVLKPIDAGLSLCNLSTPPGVSSSALYRRSLQPLTLNLRLHWPETQRKVVMCCKTVLGVWWTFEDLLFGSCLRACISTTE